MKKCEWKDGLVDGEPDKYVKVVLRFNPCDEFDGRLIKGLSRIIGGETVPIFYCMHCNGDILKPEEKPLIVKSGKTYTAYWECVNYLWTKSDTSPTLLTISVNKQLYYPGTLYGYQEGWKSFTGENPDITELTDELALLRPMCKFTRDGGTYTSILVYMDVNDYITYGGACFSECRLATAHELQEAL